MKGPVELMSLFWTTSGVFGGLEMVSRFDFRERVEAAARVGFKGIGLWHTDLEHVERQYSLKEMKMILADNDIRYVELEFLTDWFMDGALKEASDRRKRLLLEASQAIGAKHVKIGDFDKRSCPMPRLIEAFAGLCREAQDYGATIGFELMGCAMIDNLPDALALVEGAGAKNGGLILDIVQVVNLPIPYEAVSRIPQPYLIGVELNDGTLPGSPFTDPSRTRRWCGEGEYDIKGFIRAVKQTGFTGPWAVEVMSEELAPLPLDELNRLAYTTTMAQFDL